MHKDQINYVSKITLVIKANLSLGCATVALIWALSACYKLSLPISKFSFVIPVEWKEPAR